MCLPVCAFVSRYMCVFLFVNVCIGKEYVAICRHTRSSGCVYSHKHICV